MDFLEVFVQTSETGLELASGVAYANGVTGIMVEDERDFEDFMKDPNRQWDYIDNELLEQKKRQKNGITFFVTDNASGIETLNAIKAGLMRVKEEEKELEPGSLDITVKNVKEEDWANNWKKYFKPFPVGDRIVIKPSWEEYEDTDGKKVLNIDPGHIFGTGSHETTQGCIEFIEKYIKEGDRAADIGCGSGILAIAAILMGADFASAVDIDPNAVEIVKQNADLNNIPAEKYEVFAGDILNDDGLRKAFGGKSYDAAFANIVADIVIPLSDMIPEFIKDNGMFICSGIIADRLDDVTEALGRNGFEVLEVTRRKDWCAIASRLK
ncbi:50S ribosomal protein L11 methyltransferase [Lachnospiraceae bacterium NSJ-143]|nr:50S ribosomal protein L11 methyltransferase [Lachnospiraceae bacterium NSJ-143]